MALQIRYLHPQKNPQCVWKTLVRLFRVGGSGRLPEKSYWEDQGKKTPVKCFDEIPGPKSIVIEGPHSHLKLHEIYNSFFKQYGYVVKEQVHPSCSVVHLYHPEDIMRVYNYIGNHPLKKIHLALERYRRERPHIYSSAGLGVSNGPEWFRFRQLFEYLLKESTIMSYPQVKAEYFRKAEDVTDDLVLKLGYELDSKSEVDVRAPLLHWALESLGMFTLNRRLGCLDMEKNEEAERLIKAVHTIHEVVYQVDYHMNWKEYERLVEAENYFAEVIRKHILLQIADYRCEPKSVLDLLLNVEFASTQDVCTLVLDLFEGGIQSVSNTLCFALLHLAENEEKQDRLRWELVQKLPTKSSKLSTWRVEIPYVDFVIKETLRMNPPTIGTARILDQDMVLGGYNVLAGTLVILQNQVVSMQEEYFKNPHVFTPERWAEESQDNLGVGKGVESYACKPFGHGMRACIGLAFAKMEMTYAISKIVRNFEISYHHEPVGIINKLHNEPDKPVRLMLKKIYS